MPSYDQPQEWLSVVYDKAEQQRLIHECVARVVELGARLASIFHDAGFLVDQG